MPRRKRIQTLSQLANLRNFTSLLKPELINSSTVASLLKEGQRIIQEAYDNKNWNNRTYNLYNSYVAAVISGGKVLGWSFLGPEHEPEDKYARGNTKWDNTVRRYGSTDTTSGREEAINFVESYAKEHRSTKKITLIVAAAMFYAGILESHGYHVLAGIEDNMENIAAKGLILTDFKVGSQYRDFLSGSDAQIAIGPKHIAHRTETHVEKESHRKSTFETKLG